jgi:hypothetical protein
MAERVPLVQIGYWLALATWFGGVLFVAIAAPIIFKTVEDADPTLPKVLSVNLEGQHSALLAGSIFANLLVALTKIQLICATILLITMTIQITRQWQTPLYGILRGALYLGAVVLTLYNARVIWPRIEKHRQEYIDNADDPEIAKPAAEKIDRYNHEVVTILMLLMILLSLMIVFSYSISAARAFVAG